MKCEVCSIELPAEHNSVVCSDKCGTIRQMLYDLTRKYYPTPGCENCWGDLHKGCTDKCRTEFMKAGEFRSDLWVLVRLAIAGGYDERRM